MSYVIVGLGNPGEEYENSRHNAGRMVVELLAKKLEAGEWKLDQKLNALKTTTQKATLLLPQGFMNNSGASLKALVTNEKKAEQLVVVHDDIDLPLGRIKFSFNRSAGGHRGVESIIKNIKTEKFLRLRLGVCPATPSGKLKKPTGEQEVVDFILNKFKGKEEAEFKKVEKRAAEALVAVLEKGKDQAMNIFNQ